LRGVTYAATLQVKLNLVLFDKNGSTLKKKRRVKQVIEENVYLGQLPLMTDTGTFVINGTERVVVSQLHRSPGVIFEHDKGKTHSSGKILFSSRIIPYRGSWLDFEFDHHEHLFVRIDRRRKLPVTALLRAMGMSTNDIIDTFFDSIEVKLKTKSCDLIIQPQRLRGIIAEFDIQIGKQIVVKKGRRITAKHAKLLENAGVNFLSAPFEYLLGKVIASDVVDIDTGEILLSANTVITEESIEVLTATKVNKINIIYINDAENGIYISDTLRLDEIQTEIEARMSIYHVMRPGEPATEDAVNALFSNLFFNNDRYDLSRVGRMKLNRRLSVNSETGEHVLTHDDIINVIKRLIDIKNGHDVVDDVDTLANRRVRAIGEMIENQFRIGLIRVEKAVKEGLNLAETDELTPQDLINSKPVSAAVREFFGSSQLSQFMDQVNPLSGVTHKRRISALGPGGLNRERAGFEVRDVHPTHYGRICPIETPEGPNIGLISSLSTYARINPFGFIETPYRVVKNGRATNEIKYLFALEEEGTVIAQANAPLDEGGKFLKPLITARKGGDFVMVPPEEVDFMDVSPKQLVSVAASLIPFLEHDDANRALMGSNMQRQSVPLLRAEAPLVGTGMEKIVARDSGVVISAKRGGTVEFVDASKIIIKYLDNNSGEFEVDVYPLIKFMRSNQNTCINQKPIVRKGQRVVKGEIIADGPSTDRGELALGRNVLVAFLPWSGYNFEDSILVSEKILKEDIYTSIHIEELELSARDTKLGKEEITRDIPNVGDEGLAHLDQEGIVHIGAHVSPGDILVGKITPKGETQLSPEEKLLRAIFGEKAGEVRDTSLRVSPGVRGVVINTKTFARKGYGGEGGAEERERDIKLVKSEAEVELYAIRRSVTGRMRELLVGQTLETDLKSGKGKVVLTAGTKLTEDDTAKVTLKMCSNLVLAKAAKAEAQVNRLVAYMVSEEERVEESLEEKIETLRRGDDLQPGVSEHFPGSDICGYSTQRIRCTYSRTGCGKLFGAGGQ